MSHLSPDFFSVTINDVLLHLETRPPLFSPRRADAGTLAMLSVADAYWAGRTVPSGAKATPPPFKLLDLGCGYGLVGIYMALKYPDAVVHMSDIDPVAAACAERNIARNVQHTQYKLPCVFISDGFGAIQETGYDMILCNPPYHSDFSVAKRFIEKSFNRLSMDGVLCFVTKRREWYKQKFIAIFGGVGITEKDGYFVFMAQRRSRRYAKL